MSRCPAGPFPLQAASLRAVRQLSWSCPCSQESVTSVTSGSLQGSLRGAGYLGIVEEPGGVSFWDFSC